MKNSQARSYSSPSSRVARTGISLPPVVTQASGFASRFDVQAGCAAWPKLLPKRYRRSPSLV